jgi:D-alanyl-lipoteichoic acid acyltransferase DltB (MBOAT superfamily)
MLFTSYDFALFFLITLTAYWSLPQRLRLPLLLVAGYVFYGAWDYRFLALLFFTTCVDFAAGIAIYQATDARRRKLFLLLSIGTNLTVLGFFKYWNFFIDSFAVLLQQLGLVAHLPALRIVLPVGISFYTFQSMAYTIDVYRGRIAPSRDFLHYATYVAFFPQLVAGPIERFEHLYPQLGRLPAPTAEHLRRAVFLLMQGYVKKVVIADGIAPAVDEAFTNIDTLNAGRLLGGAILFTCQIYCDFCGYSEIARGVAYCFGVELMENFRTPFLSRSITEFWRRWHISLSQWLRDYLYIPLGGNRHGRWRTYRNLMTTMLLGGLWHGADWKFVVWGGLHGLLLSLERLFRFGERAPDVSPPRGSEWLRALPAMALTNLAVVAIFIFFRAASIGDAWAFVRGIAAADHLAAVASPTVLRTLALIALLDLPAFMTEKQTWILDWPLPLRVGVYTALLAVLIIFSGHYAQPFIYFAF